MCPIRFIPLQEQVRWILLKSLKSKVRLADVNQWLSVAVWDRAWAARTVSGQMWMCGDIFAAARLWRGRLLTTGRLSCRHLIVVCVGHGDDDVS